MCLLDGLLRNVTNRQIYLTLLFLEASISLAGCGTPTTSYLQTQSVLAAEDLYTSEVQVFDLGSGKTVKTFQVNCRVFQLAASPVKKELALIVQKGMSTDIATLNLDTGKTQALTFTSDVNEAGATWSPDGTSLFYYSVVGNSFRTAEARTVSSLGGDDKLFDTGGLPVIDPHISEDASTLLYTVLARDRVYDFGLETVDLSTKRAKQLLSLAFITQGSWSPDGRWIVARGCKLSLGDIFLYDCAKEEWFQVTDDPGEDGFPTWTADSQSILFSSDRAGSFDLYQLELGADNPRRLTATDDADEISPSVLPDGQNVACVVVRPSKSKSEFSYTPSATTAPSLRAGCYYDYSDGQVSPWVTKLAWRQRNAIGQFLIGRHGELIASSLPPFENVETLYLVKDERGAALVFDNAARTGVYAVINRTGQVLPHANLAEELSTALAAGYEAWPSLAATGEAHPLPLQYVFYPRSAQELPVGGGLRVATAWGIELLGRKAFYLPANEVRPRGIAVLFVRDGRSLTLHRFDGSRETAFAEVNDQLEYTLLDAREETSTQLFWNYTDLQGLPTVPPPGYVAAPEGELKPVKVHPNGILEGPPSEIRE